VYHPDGHDGPPQEIDFTPPFRRVSLLSELSRILNVTFPAPDTLETEGEVHLFVHELLLFFAVILCEKPCTFISPVCGLAGWPRGIMHTRL